MTSLNSHNTAQQLISLSSAMSEGITLVGNVLLASATTEEEQDRARAILNRLIVQVSGVAQNAKEILAAPVVDYPQSSEHTEGRKVDMPASLMF